MTTLVLSERERDIVGKMDQKFMENSIQTEFVLLTRELQGLRCGIQTRFAKIGTPQGGASFLLILNLAPNGLLLI